MIITEKKETKKIRNLNLPLNKTINHRTRIVQVNINDAKLSSREELFGDTLKKQHLRKLERNTESQTEIEEERGRGEIKEVERDRLSFGTCATVAVLFCGREKVPDEGKETRQSRERGRFR